MRFGNAGLFPEPLNRSTAKRRSYFAAFFFRFASANRSVFFRRRARFLTLSLPLLCPIELTFRLPRRSNGTEWRPTSARLLLPQRSLRLLRGPIMYCLNLERAKERRQVDYVASR